MNDGRFARCLPLTGILFVAVMVVTFGVSGNSPDSDATDAKISAYLADDQHFHHAITALILVWAATLLLVGFWAVLRRQLQAAEGGTGGLAALTFGAGIAGAVFNFAGVLSFLVPSLAAHDARHGHAALAPSIYRFVQDFGYPLWITFSIVGALAAWGTAAVVWRTRMWGRWYAWVSIVVGVVSLASIEFFPVMVFGLWIVLTSVLMMARPGAAPRGAHARASAPTVAATERMEPAR